MAVPKVFFAPPLDWLYPLAVGQSWPEGNEDLARQAAQAWTDALSGIVTLARSGNTVAESVNYSVQGASGEVFNRYWDKYVGGDDSYLGQQAQQAQRLAATLLDFAQELEYTKWAINTQLAILAVQVAYDLLAAPFTQGLSMAEAFLAVYMARSVIRMIVARLLESVLFMALPDLVAQTIQLADAWSHGKDGSFDGKRLLTDVEMGVVAGSLGALLQPLMQWRPMTALVRSAFGARTAALLPALAQGALVNVGTNAAMFYLPSPDGRQGSSPFEHWFLAALSGAFAGGVFHGLNQMHGAERPSATFRDADGGVLFHGIQQADASYSLITPDGQLAGRGVFDPEGTLAIGDRRLTIAQATFSTADGVAHHVFQSGEPARRRGFDQVLPVDTSVIGVHGTIEVPAGSTATFGPDERIERLTVHDEQGTTFYSATPDHTAFERTGRIEVTAAGGLRFLDVSGAEIPANDFHTVLDRPLGFRADTVAETAAPERNPDATVALPRQFSDVAAPHAGGAVERPDEAPPMVQPVPAETPTTTPGAPPPGTFAHMADPVNPPVRPDSAGSPATSTADSSHGRQQLDVPLDVRTPADRHEIGLTTPPSGQSAGQRGADPIPQQLDVAATPGDPTAITAAAPSPTMAGEAHQNVPGAAPTAVLPFDAEGIGKRAEAASVALQSAASSPAERARMALSGTPTEQRAALAAAIHDGTLAADGAGKWVRWTQYAAVTAMVDGQVVQMDPGEGKSFAAVMAAAQYATTTPEGVHMVTSRRNLASRDYQFAATVLGDLGFRVVRVDPQQALLPPEDGRPTIYVGTVSDFAFSRLAGHRAPGKVAIIDEIDDVLIDQARRSYILATGVAERALASVADEVRKAHALLERAISDGTLGEADFGRFPELRGGGAYLTDAARRRIQAELPPGETLTDARVERLNMAALARWGFVERDDYIVAAGKVFLLDPVTHEVLFDPHTSQESRWNGGLAQAMEARYGLEIRADPTGSRYLTTRELFARQPDSYDVVVGMSGTAKLAEPAMRGIYGLDEVAEIPRYTMSKLHVVDDSIHQDEQEKLAELVQDVLTRQEETNQPQLIIAHRNSLVADLAGRLGEHARYVDAEKIVEWGTERDAKLQEEFALAAKQKAILVINREGARGIDIKPEDSTFVYTDGERTGGGLSVTSTARSAESGRFDLQAQTRAARNGDPGDAHFYVALTDDIVREHPSDQVRDVVVQYESARGAHENDPDDPAVRAHLDEAVQRVRDLVRPAQARAERHNLIALVQGQVPTSLVTPAPTSASQQALPAPQHPPPTVPSSITPDASQPSASTGGERVRHPHDEVMAGPRTNAASVLARLAAGADLGAPSLVAQTDALRAQLAAIADSPAGREQLGDRLDFLTSIAAELTAVIDAARIPSLHAVAHTGLRNALIALDDPTLRPAPVTTREPIAVYQADASAIARVRAATIAYSISDRATGMATAAGPHSDVVRTVATAARWFAGHPVESTRSPAVEARLQGMERLLTRLQDAMAASASAPVLARRFGDVRKALHQLNLAAGRYDELQARAKTATAAAIRAAERWSAQQLRQSRFEPAERLVAAYERAAEIERRSAQLADAVAATDPAATALVEPMADALERLSAATEVLAASNLTTDPAPPLSPDLAALLGETAEAVAFAQRERAWRRSRIRHSRADLDELARVAAEKVPDATSAGLLAAQIDALYARVDAARRALAERADQDRMADAQPLVSSAERALLERVIPGGWLAEALTVLGRYRDRRDSGLLDLGHLGGQDPLSATLLASRENVRALRRQIEQLWEELRGAQRRSASTAILRVRLKQLLESHNEQLPVLVRDIKSELATVKRKQAAFAAAGNQVAVERLRWWRRSLEAERHRAAASMAAVRRNKRLLKSARVANQTAARMLATAYPDLGELERMLGGLNADEMAPSPALFGLDRHLAGLLGPSEATTPSADVDVLALRSGLSPELTIDVSTDTQTIADLRRVYVALHRAGDRQQTILDHQGRSAAIEARVAPIRQVVDGVNLIAAFQSAYEKSRKTVDAALTEAEGPVDGPRLVAVAATVGEEMTRAQFLGWLWRRGDPRSAPAGDRQIPGDLVALVNDALPDLGSDVRADVVAAIQVHEYLTSKGLLPPVLAGQPDLRDVLRATNRDRGPDLALGELRERMLRRLRELKQASPVEAAADPEIRLISGELAKAMSHPSRYEQYLRRLEPADQTVAALKAIQDATAVRLVDARHALARAEATAGPATEIQPRRDEVRELERRLAEMLQERLRLLRAELAQIRDDGQLPADVPVSAVDRELRRAERLTSRVDRWLRGGDVSGRRLQFLAAAVHALDGLWVRSSRGRRALRDHRVAEEAARAGPPDVERVARDLGQFTQWPSAYGEALRQRLAAPTQDLLAVGTEWRKVQTQRRSYLVQLTEQARDVGLLLNGLQRRTAPEARQDMLRERIGRRQDALARWSLRGSSAQPIPPDPAEEGTSLPAPARHVPGSDPLMGAGEMSPELGINPFEWPGVVVGVNAHVISTWEPLSYDVERTSKNPFGGLLTVTITTSRVWQIHYHGATLRVRETRRSTTVLQSWMMMGRIGGAVPPGSFGDDVFGTPFDLPGSYPDNQNHPPGAPPHIGPVPTAVPIPIQVRGHHVGGLLAQVILRAPYLSWETSYIPTNFHSFDHVDAVDLVVTKERTDPGADPLPDLPDRWSVKAPAVDIASTGSPLHRKDWQTKAGVGVDVLVLLQPYVGDATNGLETITTLGAIGGVLEAQITSEPKFSVGGTDISLGIEWLYAFFVSFGFKELPLVFPRPSLSGAWSALGGIGFSGVPFNRVRGRSLMPMLEFVYSRLFRGITAHQRRLAVRATAMLRQSWLHRTGLWIYDRIPYREQLGEAGRRMRSSLGRSAEVTLPILGPVLRTARLAAAEAQAQLEIDTEATMLLAELRGQAIQARLAGAELPSGTIADHAQRLARHIADSGLSNTTGDLGSVATAALAATRSATDELPDSVRGLREAVRDQLVELRRRYDELLAPESERVEAIAAARAAANQLQAQIARGVLARGIERGVDAGLTLERLLAARPDIPRPAGFAELAQEIVGWTNTASERLLDGADVVDNGATADAVIRLSAASHTVAARLDHITAVISEAEQPSPPRPELRWAFALAELRRAIFDTEPLTELARAAAAAGAATPSALPSPISQLARGVTQLPALRTAVRKPDFQIGLAVTSSALSDGAAATHVVREASAVTTEDALAWATVRPDEQRFVLDKLEAVVSFARQHDLPVHAHALISPDDLPEWLMTGGHSPVELAAIMRSHVTDLVAAYRDRIRRWTVVDQALSDTGALRNSLWRVRLGRHYISDAFHAAAAANSSAVLYLTDFDVAGENPEKTEQFFQLVSMLRREDVPLHGVGVHLRLAVRAGPDGVPFVDWSPAAVRVNLRRLAAMGLEVSIAGVDVRLPAQPSAADLTLQAEAYAEVVRIAHDIEAVRSLTIWGISDRYSSASSRFPGTGSATPFRADLTPKPALEAMLETLRTEALTPSRIRSALAVTPVNLSALSTVEELALAVPLGDVPVPPSTPTPPLATALPTDIAGLPDLQSLDFERGAETSAFAEVVRLVGDESVSLGRLVAVVERSDGRRFVVVLGRLGGALNSASEDSPAAGRQRAAYAALGLTGEPPPFVKVLMYSAAHLAGADRPSETNLDLLMRTPGQDSAILIRRAGPPVRYRIEATAAPLDAADLRLAIDGLPGAE